MLHVLSKSETEVTVSYMVTYDEVGSEVSIYHKRGQEPAKGVTLPLESLPALVAQLQAHMARHGILDAYEPEPLGLCRRHDDAHLKMPQCYDWEKVS